MNRRALLQIAGSLIGDFRESSGPADRLVGDFFAEKKFLGPRDRRFISDAFFHTLRHLRRYDEALLSAFSGMQVVLPGIFLTDSENEYSRQKHAEHKRTAIRAGFPISDRSMAQAWMASHRSLKKPVPVASRGGRAPKRPGAVLWLDIARAALGAAELSIIDIEDISEELVRNWPKGPERADGTKAFVPNNDTMQRMAERAIEVARTYQSVARDKYPERAASMPTWLWAVLGHGLPPKELFELTNALNEQAPTSLRVNTLKVSVEEARAAMEKEQFLHSLSPWCDTAIRLEARVGIAKLPRSHDGWFEYQDESSQLCSIFAAPREGTVIVDACAGAGGKTLHMAALVKNNAHLIALDSDQGRLTRLEHRRSRAGATCIRLGSYRQDGQPPATLPKADLVLIDAPCSGTGTMRRNPELRWRLSTERIEDLIIEQEKLLETWAALLPVGGVLVYATCSLIQDENAGQIERFLKRHPEFARDIEGPRATFGEDAKHLLSPAGDLALYPHRHRTDGFYAARLIKVSETTPEQPSSS